MTFLVRNPLVMLRPIMTRFVLFLIPHLLLLLSFFVAKFSPLLPSQMPKRGAIIQQLKDIKVLKDDGILSTDEFNKRDKLVTELAEL